MDMTAEQVVAITGFMATKDVNKAKSDMQQESQSVVKFRVKFEDGPELEVQSEVKKGKDVEMNVTASLPQKAMLMHLLSKMSGQVRQKFLRDFANGEIPEIPEDKQKEVEKNWEEVAGQTNKKTNGKVYVKSVITLK